MQKDTKIIEIDEEWRLSIQGMNVELQQNREIVNKGISRMDWGFVGYYGSIAQALRALPDSVVLYSEFDTLASLNARLAELVVAFEGIDSGAQR